MADIDVVKTRSNSWIWWLVAIVAVAVLLMLLLGGRGTDAPGTTAPARAPMSSTVPATPSVLVA